MQTLAAVGLWTTTNTAMALESSKQDGGAKATCFLMDAPARTCIHSCIPVLLLLPYHGHLGTSSMLHTATGTPSSHHLHPAVSIGTPPSHHFYPAVSIRIPPSHHLHPFVSIGTSPSNRFHPAASTGASPPHHLILPYP